ncbi:MAG: hypothetical protein JW742_07065 [Candidatus Aminicenantes bacterium]|nr:hypothetical protein [Candidatus Aminicenantes bacterium]
MAGRPTGQREGQDHEKTDRVYDVFSPDGIYLRQVRAPRALFLVRNEDEFLVVKRFRMRIEETPE